MTLILTNYFASVFAKEDCLSPQPPEVKRTEEILNGALIVGSWILRTSEKIKVSKGPNKTTYRIRKNFKYQICKLEFVDWNLTNVTPIFKKGNESHSGNNRPINRTWIDCKLMATIIRANMMKSFEENIIINYSQHSFRSERWNLIFFLLYFWRSSMKRWSVDIIYLDFQKAMDKVTHK